MEKKNEKIKIERPPVVVVMGHIDHGKSTLLDYIRKTNVVEDEAGNITQHISAYEVVHRDDGKDRKITFLDTPGHEAFSKMRERGANIADIAILMVSAEDGVKPQTLEAYKTITLNKVPFIVAINKIDKPGANVEKTKNELVENEIYLENYGGKVPSTEISAKTGAGIDNLLSLILILAEMENLTGVEEDLASGLVIEAHRDSKRGIETTLIIKNGTITKGMTVGVEDALCSTRIIENFKGEKVEKATFSSPIRLCGWDKMPTIGAEFKSFKNKKEAEKYAQNWRMESNSPINQKPEEETGKKIIGIVLKADVWGSIEAIEKEIGKIESESAEFKILQKGVGPISESDIKTVASSENALIVGFNVKADRSAVEIAEQRGISISYFDIIYKITEWLTEEMESRRPKIETVETIGRAKVIRTFSRTRERQIVGGKVLEGSITLMKTVRIMRREFEIGRGKIVNLEKGKEKVGTIEEGVEFGMMIESKIEIAPGDIIESFSVTQK
ncbi:translation initiation factor IF-2 [Candidatus Nomurabacteria bacterium RIFCSPLOWO2_01_FULL_40_15]|uniref:Translation initiation factor IF-2 n=1 Tax=Candidatus Nomurabacteria bacterium RIFCSPLOWO2_01_FULL_40_15 TaxID=1801772 RepID=A0A1F6X7P8_9BACT|nr:MAG: translation initiation factor IF-2 [Candidatus Nomurabacteria bacterium RIFCSPLOWO2_01_FULL_40_15]